tara:strand:- start:329 stop:580 length:252 start_codon:yes stop_codon:yes gene_type:complete
MFNNTFSSFKNSENYTAEEIAIILAGIASAIVAIVYSFKHIKSSDCLCIKCEQVVTDEPLRRQSRYTNEPLRQQSRYTNETHV